jgi:hypothetical protein
MAILGNKKVAIPIRPNSPTPDAASRREGVPFHNLFNFSRVRTPGKSITGVLEKPVLKDSRQDIPKADLAVVRTWVALEEKIVCDHKAGPFQKTQEKKDADIRPSVPGAVSSKQGAPSRGFFNFSKKQVPSNDIPKVLNRAAVSSSQSKVSKPDVKGIQRWVAMEEKIVHDPGIVRGQRIDEKKLQKIKIVGPQAQRPAASATSKTQASFGGFFSFLKPQAPRENTVNISREVNGAKEVVAKSPLLDPSQVNVAAVKNWVASEEDVVQGYKEQKTLRPKDADLLPRVPTRHVTSIPESLRTQTNVPLPQGALSAQESVRDEGKVLRGVGRFLWVLGWLVAGILVFLYAQAIFLSYQTDQKNARLESENKRLEQSFGALKNASDDQAAEMIWLRSQLQDMTWELKDARSEMVTLRNTVRTKDEIVQALKAQTQALEKILSQERAVALPPVADVPRERYSAMGASVVRGLVSSINDQQGFIVVNLGSSQGIHSGQWIMVARSEKQLAVGRVDRVYPTMSVAKLRDKKMFQMIQEGDSVFFS